MEINTNTDNDHKLKWQKYPDYSFCQVYKLEQIKAVDESTYNPETGAYRARILGTNLTKNNIAVEINDIDLVLHINDFNLVNFLDSLIDKSEDCFPLNEKKFISRFTQNDENLDVLYAHIKYDATEYYPIDNNKLFDEFAKLGKTLLKHIYNLDNEKFKGAVKGWVIKYGCLTNTESCLIYSIICKSVLAFILNDIWKAVDSIINIKHPINSPKIEKIKTKINNLIVIKGDEVHICPNLRSDFLDDSDFDEDLEDYFLFLKYFSIEFDSDFKKLKNDESIDYYKKLAILFIAKLASKIIGEYPMGFYVSFPSEISGKNDCENDLGYFVETSPKFVNLEQIIFYQLLEQLKEIRRLKPCLYCGGPIYPEIIDKTGKKRKTRHGKRYCSDKCRLRDNRKKQREAKKRN